MTTVPSESLEQGASDQAEPSRLNATSAAPVQKYMSNALETNRQTFSRINFVSAELIFKFRHQLHVLEYFLSFLIVFRKLIENFDFEQLCYTF